MAQYKDRANQPHNISITLLTRRQIRDQLGVDLLAAAHDPQQLTAILDGISSGDLLWRMLAVIEGTTEDALLSVADGTTEEHAGTALLQAIIDFFPQSSPLREPLRRLVAQAEITQAETASTVEQMLLAAIDGTDIPSAPIA